MNENSNFDESLFQHLIRHKRVPFYKTDPSDDFNKFFSPLPNYDKKNCFSSIYIEMIYSHGYEKLKMMRYLIFNCFLHNKNKEDEISHFENICLIDNMGIWSKAELAIELFSRLGKNTKKVVFVEFEKKLKIYNNYTINDYLISLLKILHEIQRKKKYHFLFVDSSNSFDFFDKKQKIKKNQEFGRKFSTLSKHKKYDFNFYSVDLLNLIVLTDFAHIFEFKMDHFYKEDMIFIDKEIVFMNRKILKLMRNEIHNMNYMTFYFLNQTYQKFIENFILFRKIEITERVEVIGCLKVTKYNEETTELILFQIHKNALEIFWIENLSHAIFIN